jgi:hypothetical protein
MQGMIDTSILKELVYDWFSFLYGDSENSKKYLKEFEENFKKFAEKFTGSTELEREYVQKRARLMWDYLHSQDEFKKRFIFKYRAVSFCKKEDCPISEIDSRSIDENNIFNIVIGPNGQFNDGDEDEYVKIIMERLDITGIVDESFYHDPFAVSSLSDGDEKSKKFAKNFLEKLGDKLPTLIVVTKEQIIKIDSNIVFKKIPKNVIHDRYIVVREDNKWKGVFIGTSINSFPMEGAKITKSHFVISKLENSDAEVIATIIKSKLL